ncbi:HBS1 N-terminus-domain-containing protein [Hygrophoropsis aurantiaca]|uniref:HBS1 N-terminus-domain-containing protein n=1 Tax=Hygrophoropsis aurantiaca TaxID=72124 RepID=A0ACB8AU74_9AGAM|nr:HBS1 N-terminus-domain-containing protein [Hygrophoropsis aurantiaca]
MSRHRLVRNMNLDNELDDDALSDGGDDGMTPEQQAQMSDAFDYVRSIMGDEATSGLDDRIIQDTLWEVYFDVQRALDWLYQEHERRAAARERRGERLFALSVSASIFKELNVYHARYSRPAANILGKALPSPPDGEQEEYIYHEVGDSRFEYEDGAGRPRVPLIVLAQQGQYQQDYYTDDYAESSGRLSPITEHTEVTEPSRHWPSKQQLLAMNNPRAPSSTGSSTSYGQVIDSRARDVSNEDYNEIPIDPNAIPPSPSLSAVKRLSRYDSPPSLIRSESRSSLETPPPRPPSAPVPLMETIPDIPDYKSKSSRAFQGAPQAAGNGTVKKSKLSMLASSRASSASRSSRSSDLESTSIVTYPALRPAPESRLSLVSTAPSTVKPSNTSKSLPPKPPSTTSSSMSSHVRRAIQTAMELEDHDRKGRSNGGSKSVSSTSSTTSTVKPPAPRSPPPHDSVAPVTSPRPQSKLALLAQAKADAIIKAKPPSSPPRELPQPHTKYLTPIANGSTVTTAITTSYQSLHSLSTPSKQEVVPLVPLASNEARQSKLAMKIKKSQEKPSSQSSTAEEDMSALPVSPMFLPKASRSRASPSAFASLLIDDPLTFVDPKDGHKEPKYGREELKLMEMYQASLSNSSRQSHSSDTGARSKRHRSKPVPPVSGPPHGFAFDSPSPDDVVFNARRGTSLARQR